MASDQPIGGMRGPSLGGISVSLGSAHSGTPSSGSSSSSSGNRSFQLESLSLNTYIN